MGEKCSSHNLDIRMSRIGGSKLSCTSLLLAMLEEFGITQNGNGSTVVDQGYGRDLVQSFLIFSGQWKNNWNRLAYYPTVK